MLKKTGSNIISAMHKKPLLLIAVLAIISIAIFLILKPDSEEKLNQEKKSLPLSQSAESAVISPAETKFAIKKELNLDVPFTSQAPDANWDAVHEEACEEASLLMADRYLASRVITGKSDAEEGIQTIISWERKKLGFFESTNAQETARVAREMLGLTAEVIENPTVEEIKIALNKNKLILIPFAGRELDNPFYKSPGPLYHMLVIKGYTETKFITNDPGTKNGADYPYDYDRILDANHDWNNGDVQKGVRVMIVLSK